MGGVDRLIEARDRVVVHVDHDEINVDQDVVDVDQGAVDVDQSVVARLNKPVSLPPGKVSEPRASGLAAPDSIHPTVR